MNSNQKINECKKILSFWEMEEVFSPVSIPKLQKKVKMDGKEIIFDRYCKNETDKLPLDTYKSFNQYLKNKNISEEKLYDKVNIYFGKFKTREFVQKMAEECDIINDYPEINEISGDFFAFYVQINMDGKVTCEGFQISPFFYALVEMMRSKSIKITNINETKNKFNNHINDKLKGTEDTFKSFSDIVYLSNSVFRHLGIDRSNIGLFPNENVCACRALKNEEDSLEFNSFYAEEIKNIKDHFEDNKKIIDYIAALLGDSKYSNRIDTDVELIKKWLDVDKYPLAKYPSKFSPTLMQQVAINIAISENERNEKIFSVNGPPGTGKTTLLKEIIASNVEKMAEKLIEYGPNSSKFEKVKILSESNSGYTEVYYRIPEELKKYGILVVSNNNGAVENITLELPRAAELTNDKTRTDYFDRNKNEEVYFSRVADTIIEDAQAWGLISARMGRKSYITKVLNSCIFRKTNDPVNKVTLDSADSKPWNEAVDFFNSAKQKVLMLRGEIKKDKEVLKNYELLDVQCNEKEKEIHDLEINRDEIRSNIREIQKKIEFEKQLIEEHINTLKEIKANSFLIHKLLIVFGIGELGKKASGLKQKITNAKIAIIDSNNQIVKLADNEKNVSANIEKETDTLDSLIEKREEAYNRVYLDKYSLKSKYSDNLADSSFYCEIEKSEKSQAACPWTFAEYDKAREELFYASLQVRKSFILESNFIRRNLFVYESYNNGKYTGEERRDMFEHLINTLSILIPVISSTFASVGRFLNNAGESSMGMLIIDESGQAIPQSALGALYRTEKAVVVGDPLQVEPVFTMPQVLVDILADTYGVSDEYKNITNSAQVFADKINEFAGMIGERKVGCPLVVHRRCIEPMFSISNRISYGNRMFNYTKSKEKKHYIIEESCWINVKGEEKDSKNHFVSNQAEKICEMIEKKINLFDNFFADYKTLFIITPFRTVSDEMKEYLCNYFVKKGIKKDVLREWAELCIGTVHTFQGKDADEVIIALGCSSKSSGAMNWVVKKPNIINVACTRAKERVAFVGNYDDWKQRPCFREFIPSLIKDKIQI